MPIRRLPSLLVNQIAAGEVIERPASVAKELIENAIDAGARRITIEIESGGRELIRVTDDGCGIDAEELPLALAAHATSKIDRAEDLDAIATMGFRGEALASIASVSRTAIRSRTRDADSATEIAAEGDALGEPRPVAGSIGTTVTMRNLFFNTPARRKFLRTDQTEAGRICDVVQNLAIAHPSLGFELTVNGRKTVDLPTEQKPRQRVLEVIGSDLAGELLELDADERGVRLWGLLGRPSIARGTSKHQRVFLNGRLINDRTVSHAVKEAYRGLIDPTRYPTLVLFLLMDPAGADVNVHPAKAEVRFRNQTAVHGAVLSAIRRRLREADLVPELDVSQAPNWRDSAAVAPSPGPTFSSGLSGVRSAPTSPHSTGPEALVDYFKRLDPKQKGFVYSEVREALRQEALDEEVSADELTLPRVRSAPTVLQVHSSYIVTQDEDGLVIIDQHALHERVMFEKFMRRLNDGPLESQRLLMPATLEAESEQVDLLPRLAELFRKIGIDAEAMGPRTVAIHAFTSLLFERGVEPQVFMKELLDRAINEGLADDPEAALHEVVDMMSCKAAVKAGDRLGEHEIEELLRFRDTVERSTNCPHGRPTTLRLPIRELEKQFGRR